MYRLFLVSARRIINIYRIKIKTPKKKKKIRLLFIYRKYAIVK